MGQNVNPIVFRLGKTTHWKQQYFEKKTSETGSYSFNSLEIKKFIHKLFKNNGLLIQDWKLQFNNENSLHLHIAYYNNFKASIIRTNLNKKHKIRFVEKTKKNEKFKTLIKKFKTLIKIKNSKNAKSRLKHLNFKFNKVKLKNLNFKLNKLTKTLIVKKTKTLKNSESRLKNLNFKFNKFIKNSYFEKLTVFNKFCLFRTKKRRVNNIKTFKQYLKTKKYSNFKNVKTNSFIEKIFKSLQVFLNRNVNIFLTLKLLNKKRYKAPTIKYLKRKVDESIFEEKLKVKFAAKVGSLRKYKTNKFFKEGVNIIYNCRFASEPADLLAEFVIIFLPKLKRHKYFLRFIKSALSSFCSQNKSIKLKIKGRLNGAPRAKRYRILVGKGIPAITLDKNINYAEKAAYTAKGTFGVKVWVHSKT